MLCSTYRAQGYRRSSQPDQAAISGVGLVHGVGILVAELMDNSLDLVVVACGQTVPNQALELERAAFPLVVELVVECLCDVGIHADKRGGRECMGGSASPQASTGQASVVMAVQGKDYGQLAVLCGGVVFVVCVDSIYGNACVCRCCPHMARQC